MKHSILQLGIVDTVGGFIARVPIGNSHMDTTRGSDRVLGVGAVATARTIGRKGDPTLGPGLATIFGLRNCRLPVFAPPKHEELPLRLDRIGVTVSGLSVHVWIQVQSLRLLKTADVLRVLADSQENSLPCVLAIEDHDAAVLTNHDRWVRMIVLFKPLRQNNRLQLTGLVIECHDRDVAR
jgi:hypothetical protein